ncbi:MAG: penicillin acylase family protein [Stackebrandtia sp.]
MDRTPLGSRSPARRRLLAVGRWGLLTVTVLALIASLTVAWGIRRSFPQTDGEATLPGLSADVEVTRDRWGVPQIYADTAADLFAAQGYVHAQDRFFEMDFRRHVTSGRLAELFGPDQTATDATIRTMGWRRVAEQEWELLGEETRGYFTAYADGVNAYLDGRSPDQVSLEYTLLGLDGLDYEIEPWDPIDGLAWLKAMAWDLRGNYDDELDRALLAADGFSEEQIAELYPPYPETEHTPIVTEGAMDGSEFSPDAETLEGDRTSKLATPSLDALEGTQDATEALDGVLGGGADSGLGSNSWVLSGELTDTGKPILANDPHLGPVMPSLWYQAGLHCREVDESCPFDVVGFTLSGVPGVVIGHNGQISWGFTNLGPDVTDFYLERIDGDKYLVDGEWRPLETREETIEVAGGDSETITVRATEHGPLMSDLGDRIGELADDPPDGDGEEYGVALRWTALEPGRTAEAISTLNTASDFEEFRAAAEKFDVPAQNLVYADVEGHIGYQAPGRIPVRGKGDGSLPAPGWDSSYDWQDYVDFAELPYMYNPGEGFVVTANNAVVDGDYPHHLTGDWAYGYRSQRIRDMIEGADKPVSVDDVARMQLDSTNTLAAPVVEALLSVDDVDGAAEALSLLEGWDLGQEQDSAAAAYFNATWRRLLLDVFDELPDGMKPGGGERWGSVVAGILDDAENPWWDDSSTQAVETRDDMLRLAATQAADELVETLGASPKAWRWGDLHTLAVTHQSLGVSGVEVVEDVFNADEIGVAGGDGLVNASGWDLSKGYEVDAVPSMRMVVDMSDLDNSGWINLTGNSGHAHHSNYADQLPLWQTGELLPMCWSQSRLRDEAQETLTLTANADG